ncbi:MAG: GTPase HflX [Hyphomicrobiaceae bacterium]|nr:GTPase HflX [Hyphomicrobiaceae bacterium]
MQAARGGGASASRSEPARPGNGARGASPHSPGDRLAEAAGLAGAIDLDVAAKLLVPLARPQPATLFGSGKVEELKELVGRHEAELVVIDHAVTPIQQRNLERAWNTKVLDRTGLILEIFGRRARTREGRLQVELAHLTYQKSRLVRSWTHLERQRGGYGFLGGPGETQIETDRRLIQERIDAIRKELDVVVRTRGLHRSGRARVPYPLVAIVGYTNAGKSTLFNRLTGAGVLAMDQVFATLDPTMRELKLDSGRRVILSDTVGFISDLPTSLVAAFRATLEEVVEADLILHVRDISHPESQAQRADVESVLADLGIEVERSDGLILEVWNKIDLLPPEALEETWNAARRAPSRPLLVSAANGIGLDELGRAIDARLGSADETLTITVPATAGGLLAWLHENTQVLARETGESGQTVCRVRIAAAKKGRLASRLRRDGLSAAPPPAT